ncbi:Add66p ASCRUDRAFT_9995 [Ascoidea rubescens DSM 1968]|uniref:Proteasome assembly chaperone 2 n=1 Tax=Ascoidea rubescens DSM 1968 TaxID=1344418 RepID=A0A1D2VAD5_9ASCO|nr:hypothetical protein ASCRUDRAFT_9995 [Ascoidea rubescens DSM 1968]ODV58646.1 hypothetical protein ASCRUDRAFT_9995 [Ascoidea rubescens DSM 1968]
MLLLNLFSPELAQLLHGSKLVLPAVSFANVPQLAVDLLLHNLNFKLVARLSNDYLYPFVSPIDTSLLVDSSNYNNELVSTSLEVFYSADYNLTTIQQRAPVLPGFTSLFISDVLINSLFKKFSFSEIIVLTSNDMGINFNNNNIFTFHENLNSIDSNSLKFIKTLKDQLFLIKDQNINLKIIEMFVYEGDNFDDAQILFKTLIKKYLFKDINYQSILSNNNKILEKVPKNQRQQHLTATGLIKPISWSGAYGDKPVPNSIEEGIFG